MPNVLCRIRTTRSSDSALLQDIKYYYDPVGNITMQTDDAQQDVYYDNTVAEPTNDYTYDALYRLIKCAGREHAGSNAAVSYNDSTRVGYNPLPTDASAMRRYIQYYAYDAVGNMLQMKHTTTGGTGNWTPDFDIDTASNRLTGSSIGSSGTGTESYTYDARGNMANGMNHLVSMTYNEENCLEQVEITTDLTAYYQYDHSGHRIRKTLINTASNITQVRKYVGEWEVYQKIDTALSSVILERETLKIDDHEVLVAIIETPTVDALSTGETQLLRYQYGNNLNTVSLELDDSGAIISYEEYFPFGSTSYQGGRSAAECSLKRYRFTQKERDNETGLNYHDARYYAPWLARWCAVDTKEVKFSPESPYNYGHNSPIIWHDPDGEEPQDGNAGKAALGFTLPVVTITAEKKRSWLGRAVDNIEKIALEALVVATAIVAPIAQAVFDTVATVVTAAFSTAATIVSNLLLGALRARPEDAGRFAGAVRLGQAVGDFLSVGIGFLGTISGLGVTVLGALATASGVGAVVGLGTTAVGIAVSRWGYEVMTQNTRNMSSQKGERNRGNLDGQDDKQWKHWSPDPSRPGWMKSKDQQGRTIFKKITEEFKNWWNKKHKNKQI